MSVWSVQNLSLGGASLVGDAPLTPGERVRLSLCLPGWEPISVTALVLRRQLATRARCALAFAPLEEATSRTLAAALEAWSGAQAGRGEPGRPFEGLVRCTDLLVIADEVAAAAALGSAVTALGRTPFRVTSALEAAACLAGAPALASVLVHEDLLQHGGWALLPFVRDTRPNVRRLVVPAEVSSFRLNLTLRTGLVDAVVEPPFDAGALARKLVAEGAVARHAAGRP